MDSVLGDSDVEEEAQEEVDKVLFELTDGLLGATTSTHVPQVGFLAFGHDSG